MKKKAIRTFAFAIICALTVTAAAAEWAPADFNGGSLSGLAAIEDGLLVELAGGDARERLVVEYGFAKDAGRLLEIRIVHFEDAWVLRLRDNCRAFDPVKWIQLNESDDPTVNMGIKLVCAMAKDVTYVSTLDLNIITLRI